MGWALAFGSGSTATWPSRVAGAFVTVLLGAATACSSDDPRPAPMRDPGSPGSYEGCEHVDFTPCPIHDADCQQRIFDAVSCMRGDPGGELPPITVATPDEFLAMLELMLDGLEQPEADIHLTRALAMLGLMLEQELEAEELVDVEVDGIGGVYLFDTKEIVIVDRDYGRRSTDIAVAILAHELTHALQDQEHDLAAFEEEHAASFDSMVSTLALIEGEATVYENAMYGITTGCNALCYNSARFHDRTVSVTDELALEESSALGLAFGLFPYTHGARFTAHAWREGGQDAIRALFAAPPLSTLEVMSPRDFADGLVPARLDDEPPEPLPGFEALSDDTLGAWLLYLFLARELIDPASAQDLTRSWRGDRLLVYGDDAAPATALLWQIVWATPDAAARFAEAVLPGAGPAGATWQAFADGSTSVLVATDDATLLDDWVAAAR